LPIRYRPWTQSPALQKQTNKQKKSKAKIKTKNHANQTNKEKHLSVTENFNHILWLKESRLKPHVPITQRLQSLTHSQGCRPFSVPNSHKRNIVGIFFFGGGIGVCPQGFALAKQVLYGLSHTSSL
jgi:hypothetical protein